MSTAMKTRPHDEVAVEAAFERGGLEGRRGRVVRVGIGVRPSVAGRALGGREELLGAPRSGPAITLRRVGDERAVLDERQVVAVHAPGRRTLDPLAAEVELRAVARALEPSRRVAERDPAAEVRALLREREEHGPPVLATNSRPSGT